MILLSKHRAAGVHMHVCANTHDKGHPISGKHISAVIYIIGYTINFHCIQKTSCVAHSEVDSKALQM